jgi:site-specific recombinase XerD
MQVLVLRKASVEIKRQTGSLRVGETLYTASVLVRHNTKCADRDKGGDWTQCDCRKSILVYNGATRKQGRISAHTRSWAQASILAEGWLDQFDPFKLERKKQEAQAVTVEKAVFSYLQDMITRLGDNSTVSRARTLFGDVDAEGNVKRDGKLFAWLNKQLPRPNFISDLTVPHLSAWRSAWDYDSDLTTRQSWSEVRTFFKFCVSQGWLTKSPAQEIRFPKVARGNRTGTFSDEQYDAILEASRGDQRVHTFLELLRWSGMALVDAVEFNRKTLGKDGVLRYVRVKTGTLGTVKLPEHVVILLRDVPLDADNTQEQPFRRKGITLDSSIHEWRLDLQSLFAKAGITAVKTDIGERPAHPHMLRDTCAVWYLRQGMSLHGVAKILGHSDPTITAKHYLPFVKEMETAHIAENKGILDAIKPKAVGNVVAFAR